jgi:hypothetical protein
MEVRRIRQQSIRAGADQIIAGTTRWYDRLAWPWRLLVLGLQVEAGAPARGVESPSHGKWRCVNVIVVLAP